METKLKDAYQKIEQYAANPLGEMRVIDDKDFLVGKHVRQGDLYIIRMDPSTFDKTKYKVTQNRQLAPGSTKGSRHTVTDAVTVYAPVKEQEVLRQNDGFTMLGPVVESKERFSVDHPEHAAMSCPAGTYQISYQIDPITQRKVQD
jgi:hypothetical protein